MTRRGAAAAWLVALALIAGAAPGHVAADAAPAGDNASYAKLVAEGLQEFDHGNWEEATALFERAHAINPNARTLRALGLCAFEARRYTEALTYLKAAIDDKRKPLTAKQRAELQNSIERAEHYVGYVRLSVQPEDASVRIDGQLVTLSPGAELPVNAGLLEVEVSAPDYETQVRRVRVTSEGHEEISVQLTSLHPVAEAPADTAAPDAESHPNAAATAASPSDDRGSGVGVWKWVAGGAAVAGIAAGVAGRLLSNADAKKWNGCRDAEDEKCAGYRDSAKSENVISIVGFAAGGAFGALSAVLFVLDAKHAEQATALRACAPGPGDVGVQCSVQF
jgi:hypothetical protein